MCVVCRDRERIKERRWCTVYALPNAGKPGVEKSGFVYADAHSEPS